MKEQSTTNQQTPVDIFKNAIGMSIGLSVVMIILGFFAVGAPSVAGIGVSNLVGWIIILSGFTYLAYAFAAQGAGGFIWRTLVGLVYVIGGFYLIFNPGIGVTSLTLAVAIIFIAEGVLQTIGYFQVRSAPGSGWVLFDGIVALALGIMIAYQWPGSSTWAIGTIVGVNLLISGLTRLMYSISARKTVNEATA